MKNGFKQILAILSRIYNIMCQNVHKYAENAIQLEIYVLPRPLNDYTEKKMNPFGLTENGWGNSPLKIFGPYTIILE